VNRVFDIGHNDLRLFFRSKTAYLWLFGIPTAMVYLLSFAVRAPGDPSNRRAPVAIDNKDTNFMSRVFLDIMTNHGVRVVEASDTPSVVHISSDFTQRVLAGEKSQIKFDHKPESADADSALVELRMTRALVEMNSDLLQAASASHGSLSNLTESRMREIMSKPNPAKLNARFAGRKPMPSGFSFSLPGNLVMYLTMNLLIFGGANTAAGRRNGTLRRIATTPASRLEIVLGKIYGYTLLGGAQILYFILLGRFLFHLNLGANLPGVLLILFALAWAASALGVLAGSCIQAEDRVVPACVMTGLMLGALGGCWWPLEMAPDIFKKIAFCLPSGWALSGLHQMISFGSGPQAAVIPALALLSFGAIANLLAIRFFRV
jgi:ABC-type multidrug transport system permease subunit